MGAGFTVGGWVPVIGCGAVTHGCVLIHGPCSYLDWLSIAYTLSLVVSAQMRALYGQWFNTVEVTESGSATTFQSRGIQNPTHGLDEGLRDHRKSLLIVQSE